MSAERKSTVPERKAVLAYGYQSRDKHGKDSVIEECLSLCEAAGISVTGVITQQSDHPDPRIFFHSGKVAEIRAAVTGTEAEMVVLAMRMPYASLRRLGEAVEVPVMDRTELILDIFAKRANSRESQLQVEIASLRHRLSSVNESGDRESHARGGSMRNRGAGEIRSVQLRRAYAGRIRELNRQLEKLEKAAGNAEDRRKRSLLRRAALVGYTNSGKSSFLNTVMKMCAHPGNEVLEKDMLFATLDTSVRNVTYGMRHFLLYDTVGFVSDLPHELVESFRSTLSSVRDADLLIEVIDVSDPHLEEKTEICEQTLKQIGADDIPVLRVYNKADLLKGPTEYEPLVSCVTGEGMEDVLARIADMLYPNEVTFRCFIPYEQGNDLHRAAQMLDITVIEETEEGYLISVSGPERLSGMLRKYRIGGEHEYQTENE